MAFFCHCNHHFGLAEPALKPEFIQSFAFIKLVSELAPTDLISAFAVSDPVFVLLSAPVSVLLSASIIDPSRTLWDLSLIASPNPTFKGPFFRYRTRLSTSRSIWPYYVLLSKTEKTSGALYMCSKTFQ